MTASADMDVVHEIHHLTDTGPTVGNIYTLDTTITASAADADNDGVLAQDDCDDNDSSLGAVAYDADCDGVLSVEDCDDLDPTVVNSNMDDLDCDGILTVDDL